MSFIRRTLTTLLLLPGAIVVMVLTMYFIEGGLIQNLPHTSPSLTAIVTGFLIFTTTLWFAAESRLRRAESDLELERSRVSLFSRRWEDEADHANALRNQLAELRQALRNTDPNALVQMPLLKTNARDPYWICSVEGCQSQVTKEYPEGYLCDYHRPPSAA